MEQEVEIVKPKNAKEWFKNLWRVVRAYGHWLWKARPILLVVAVSALCGVCMALVGFSERSFRLAGLALQLLGVIEVLTSIWEARENFVDRPEVFTWPRWRAERPAFYQRRINLRANVSLGGITASGTGTVEARLTGQPIEQRVEQLEKQHRELRRDLGQLGTETRKQFSDLKTDLAKEREERTAAVARVDQAVGKLELSGLHWAEAGAISLLLGLILATGSHEWHCLFT